MTIAWYDQGANASEYETSKSGGFRFRLTVSVRLLTSEWSYAHAASH